MRPSKALAACLLIVLLASSLEAQAQYSRPNEPLNPTRERCEDFSRRLNEYLQRLSEEASKCRADVFIGCGAVSICSSSLCDLKEQHLDTEREQGHAQLERCRTSVLKAEQKVEERLQREDARRDEELRQRETEATDFESESIRSTLPPTRREVTPLPSGPQKLYGERYAGELHETLTHIVGMSEFYRKVSMVVGSAPMTPRRELAIRLSSHLLDIANESTKPNPDLDLIVSIALTMNALNPRGFSRIASDRIYSAIADISLDATSVLFAELEEAERLLNPREPFVGEASPGCRIFNGMEVCPVE